MRRRAADPFPVLLVALLLAGCAAPARGGPAPATPASGDLPSTAASPPVSPTPPDAPPPAEPTRLPDDARGFTLHLPARAATDHAFLVNATQRVLVTLTVRNAEPAPSGFGATALASGPDGTRQQDSGMLPEGGAAFALRLAPFDQPAEEGPALVRVRVSATVPVVVEGRIDVDADVPGEGGSTVP
jgi:hypothetical protein